MTSLFSPAQGTWIDSTPQVCFTRYNMHNLHNMEPQSNEEWQIEEGIPQVDDPFIQQYMRGRSSLILEEQKQRHGG